MNTSATFAQLDSQFGVRCHEDSSLDRWYVSVKDKPVGDLTIDDLGRAVRQAIHLPYVIPVALRALDSDPLAGYQYDGELMSAIARVPSQFWTQHPSLADQAISRMRQSRELLDEDVRKKVDAFMNGT